MKMKVRYNGGTETYKNCTSSTKLVLGKEYEVISSEDLGYQTNYILRGVEGKFNSVWFDEVDESSKAKSIIHLAIGETIPKVDENYSCARIEFIEGKPKLLKVTTTLVQEVVEVGLNVYYVKTINSVYIVKVNM